MTTIPATSLANIMVSSILHQSLSVLSSLTSSKLIKVSAEVMMTVPIKLMRRPLVKHARPADQSCQCSDLTSHLWSIVELLVYKVPPELWQELKKRGRKRISQLPDLYQPKRTRGIHRLRLLPNLNQPK